MTETLMTVFDVYNESNPDYRVEIDSLHALKDFKEEGIFLSFFCHLMELKLFRSTPLGEGWQNEPDVARTGQMGSFILNDGKTTFMVYTDSFSPRIRFVRSQFEIYRSVDPYDYDNQPQLFTTN